MPDVAIKHAVGANGRYRGWNTDCYLGKIILAQLSLQFQLAILGDAEQNAASCRDSLASFYIAFKYVARNGRANIKPRIAGACFGKLRVGNIHPGTRCVAGRSFAVDISFGDKSALDQLCGAVEFILRELEIGARYTNLCFKRRCLLCLHRTVNAHEHIALAYPVARIDINLKDASPFTNNTDRNFAACSQSAGGIDGAHDCIAARCNYGDCLRLSCFLGVCRQSSGIAALTEEIICSACDDQDGDDNRSDSQPSTIAVRDVLKRLAIQRAAHRCFVIHTGVPNSVWSKRLPPMKFIVSLCYPNKSLFARRRTSQGEMQSQV